MRGTVPQMRNILIAGISVLALLFSQQTMAQPTATISIDAQQRFQTMTGWEVLARVWEYDKRGNRFDPSWQINADEIFDTLINDLGINRVRIELRSGAENPVDYWRQFERGEISYKTVKANFYNKINDDSNPSSTGTRGFQFSFLDFQVEKILLPLMRRATARGERIYVNLTFVDFGKDREKGNISYATQPEEYAELIVAAFRHLKTRFGVVPDALEIILEPENTVRWRGKQIGAGASAAVKRLLAEGFEPEIILPSTVNAASAVPFFEDAIQAPGLRERVKVIAYHRYSGASETTLRAIRAKAAEYGIRTEMLEYTKGTYRDLYKDLTIANVSAWQLYSIAWPREPGELATPSVLVNVTKARTPSGQAYLSDQGRYLAQYFRYVRMGAQRIGAVSDTGHFSPVAFENTDGTQVVVIMADRPGAITIEGLPHGNYKAFYTTEKVTGRILPAATAAVGEQPVFNMPAEGVLTVYSSILDK